MKKFGVLIMTVLLILLAGCVSSAKSNEQIEQQRKIDIDAAYKSWNDSMKEQDWKRAVDAYTNLIINYPDYVSAYDYRGIAYLCLGMKEQAVNDFNEALKIDPDRWYTKQNMLLVPAPTTAVIAFQRGTQATKKSTQIEAFTEAIQLYPNFFNAYNDRGVAYFYKYMIDEAEADWNKANELWPDHYIVLYNLARIYKFNGDYGKAIEYFERSISIKPNYAEGELDETRKLNSPQSTREANLVRVKILDNGIIRSFLKQWGNLNDENKAWFRTKFPDVYKACFED